MDIRRCPAAGLAPNPGGEHRPRLRRRACGALRTRLEQGPWRQRGGATRPREPERPRGSMRASPESRRVVPRPGGARSAGGARRRARRRIRECAPCPRGPRAARTAGTPFGPSGGGPLPRTRTTNVIFDRSGEGLTHGPIPADVRMETIRGSPQAVRIPGIRDRGVGIAKQDPEDLRQVLDPRIEAEDVPRRASRSHVVWEDGSCDGHDAGVEDVRIHRGEVTLDGLRCLPPEDVVHSRQDDRVRRTDLEDVSPEPIANLLRGLAVDPPVQDGPFRMGSRHPVFVLALWIPIASRRRFEGRAKTGGARGRGVAEADDSQGPRGHGQTPGFTEKMLTIAFVESLGAMTQMVAPGIRTPLHRQID